MKGHRISPGSSSLRRRDPFFYGSGSDFFAFSDAKAVERPGQNGLAAMRKPLEVIDGNGFGFEFEDA
jgi:hypothetical protein